MVLQDSEEGPFWNAFSSAEPEIPATAQVEVVAGGQPGEYPATMILPLALVLEAVREFVATGGRSEAVTCEQD